MYMCAPVMCLHPGVMLIDRNDELAALHEKAHLQEAQIAAGAMGLSLRDDEVGCRGPAACQQTWVAAGIIP